jgi:anti-anti-sigma factor
MEIDVGTRRGNVLVTVVHPCGDLDTNTHTELIERVRKLIAEGAKDVVIDLTDVPFISSAGLMAIHTLSLLLRGEKSPDSGSGRAALKKMAGPPAGRVQKHIKLVGLHEGVADTFEKAGFSPFFQIFDDVEKAVSSF